MTIPEGVVLRITDRQVNDALLRHMKHRFHGGEDVFMSLCIDIGRDLKAANRDNALSWHDHNPSVPGDNVVRAIDALVKVLPGMSRDEVATRVRSLVQKAYEDMHAQVQGGGQ